MKCFFAVVLLVLFSTHGLLAEEIPRERMIKAMMEHDFDFYNKNNRISKFFKSETSYIKAHIGTPKKPKKMYFGDALDWSLYGGPDLFERKTEKFWHKSGCSNGPCYIIGHYWIDLKEKKSVQTHP